MAPNSRIADVTSVVMMGRRIKSSGIFMAACQQSAVRVRRLSLVTRRLSLVFNLHLGPWKEHELTVGHHLFSRRQTLLNDRQAAHRGARHNRRDGYREVGVDLTHVLACLTRLHSLVRDYDQLRPAGESQGHVDEGPRRQPPVEMAVRTLDQACQ